MKPTNIATASCFQVPMVVESDFEKFAASVAAVMQPGRDFFFVLSGKVKTNEATLMYFVPSCGWLSDAIFRAGSLADVHREAPEQPENGLQAHQAHVRCCPDEGCRVLDQKEGGGKQRYFRVLVHGLAGEDANGRKQGMTSGCNLWALPTLHACASMYP